MTTLHVNKTDHTISIQKIKPEITFASIFLHLGPDWKKVMFLIKTKCFFRCIPLVTLKLVQFTHSN